jgi:fluoroquinolone resistance protein
MIEISSGCEYEYQEFKNINSDRGLVAQAEFQNCTFSQCDFSRSTFDGCRFYDCTFQSCDLSLINPKDSSYRHSTLENCKLVGVDWAKASEGFSADFDNCIISLSNFFGMNLNEVSGSPHPQRSGVGKDSEARERMPPIPDTMRSG